MIEILWIIIRRSAPATSTPIAEGGADRHQDAEQHERDDDGQADREDVRIFRRMQVAPDERQELHALHRFLDEQALLEVQRAPRALGGVRVVRDHDDRLAVLAVERLQQVEDLVAGLAIEVAGRLVAEQQRRVGDDGARDADALLLAAGELPRIVLRAVARPTTDSAVCTRLLPLGRSTSFVSSSGSSTLRSAVSTGSRL